MKKFEINKVGSYYEIRALSRNAKILVNNAPSLKEAKARVKDFELIGTWDHLFD